MDIDNQTICADLLAATMDKSLTLNPEKEAKSTQTVIDQHRWCILCPKEGRFSHVVTKTYVAKLCHVCSRSNYKFLANSWMSPTEVENIRQLATKKLLEQKKLHLILDIDNTLLQSINVHSLKTQQKMYLKANRTSMLDNLFMLNNQPYSLCVKLRPFVRTFLKVASTLFSISLYTRANRSYAKTMARLLDPQDCYFDGRIISRDDIPIIKIKTLDRIIAHKRATVIVDDREQVWPTDGKNLLHIEPYHYFDKYEYFGKKGGDESEPDDFSVNPITTERLHLRQRNGFIPDTCTLSNSLVNKLPISSYTFIFASQCIKTTLFPSTICTHCSAKTSMSNPSTILELHLANNTSLTSINLFQITESFTSPWLSEN
ncbi:hypothetical protein ACFE04_004702 [Oxalis oulophora]